MDIARPLPIALYRAHVVLITAAIAMAVILSVWGGWGYSENGDSRSLLTGVLGACGAMGLGAYLRWFLRRHNQ